MKYLVATEVGGVMEQPHYTYTNIQWIEANNKKEAREKYNKKNNCSYYYGRVIGNEVTGRRIYDEETQHNSFC